MCSYVCQPVTGVSLADVRWHTCWWRGGKDGDTEQMEEGPRRKEEDKKDSLFC